MYLFLTKQLLAVALLISVVRPDIQNIPVAEKAERGLQPHLPTGKWLNGTFSMSNWWSYDGKQYVGNPYSQSIAFNFSEKDKSEFFLVIKTNTGYCNTEAFTYLKGTVKFTEGERSFTFIPVSGSYRGFYSCASGSNFNRPAKTEELKPVKYYWSMEKDSQGRETMVIRFNNDPSSAGSYFKKADW
jgi:hypothetical protein